MENAKINGEIVSPQNVDEMNDEQFDAYIKSAKDGEVQAASGTAEPAENAGPYMSFDTKEALQEYQDKTIGNRLREIRESGERISGVCELAKQRDNTDSGEVALNLLKKELAEKNAGEAGLSLGQYELMNELRALKSETDYQRRVDEIQNEWKKEEAALKNIVPNFSLEQAFENPDFYNAVVENHMSVTEAYPLLKSNRYDISEIGNLTSGVGGYIKRDVLSMSDSEFDDYIKKIKNS